jgi:hypothetical protein
MNRRHIQQRKKCAVTVLTIQQSDSTGLINFLFPDNLIHTALQRNANRNAGRGLAPVCAGYRIREILKKWILLKIVTFFKND